MSARPVPEGIYADPALAALYDAANGRGARARPDFDAVARAAGARGAVLDLGCGTGELAASLADGGRRVVGVDPAEAMLAVARARPGGDRVRWVRAAAQDIALGGTFDVIAWTGHAFQCLPDAAAARAALARAAAHLAPGGVILFDTRDPASRYWTRWCGMAHVVPTPEGPARVTTHAECGADGVVTYTQDHVLPGGALPGRTRGRAAMRLLSPSVEEVTAWLAAAGLTARLSSDWTGTPRAPGDVEIVVRARHAG